MNEYWIANGECKGKILGKKKHPLLICFDLYGLEEDSTTELHFDKRTFDLRRFDDWLVASEATKMGNVEFQLEKETACMN